MQSQPIVSLNESAKAMGRKGGRATSEAKRVACAKNSAMSRGAVAQMAKHLHGTNLRADDRRIFAIKRDLHEARIRADAMRRAKRMDARSEATPRD